jgi:hypothetical protein
MGNGRRYLDFERSDMFPILEEEKLSAGHGSLVISRTNFMWRIITALEGYTFPITLIPLQFILIILILLIYP